MATVFWNAEGEILIDFLDDGCIVKSIQFISTLKKVTACLQWVWTSGMMDIFLLYDNVTPHINCQTTEEIIKIGWEVLHHLPYILHLAPSYFYLFMPLKEAHHDIHFDDEKAVKNFEHSIAWEKDHAFYQTRIYVLVKRWARTVEKNRDYIEKWQINDKSLVFMLFFVYLDLAL